MIEQTPIVTFEGQLTPFEEVDYLAEARERTTSQFKDRDVFDRILQIILADQIDFQVVCRELIQERSLDSAEGEQLDVIGRIVGQPRQLFNSVIIRYFGFDGASGASPYKSVTDTTRTYGPFKGSQDVLLGVRELTDAEFRRLIKVKILKNTSSANITAFNDAVRLLFGIDEVDYQEDVPAQYVEGAATITISIGRDYNDPELSVFPGLDEVALADRFLNRPLGVGILYQDPITFYANFKTQTYEQFVFGQDGTSVVTFNDMFDFARPYTDDYYDSSGVLQTAAIDEPRFGYDQSTLDPLGILINGPNEVLTHTWGIEANDSQGTVRITLQHDNPTATEVAMVLEGVDFKLVLFREDTYWKLRAEWEGTQASEQIISQYPTDTVTASISYTPTSVFFLIEDEDRFVPIVVDYGDTNIRGFDMRIGGTFTANNSDVYNHFNGAICDITYLRPYIGTNEDAVVDGLQITTEQYDKIITEAGIGLAT